MVRGTTAVSLALGRCDPVLQPHIPKTKNPLSPMDCAPLPWVLIGIAAIFSLVGLLIVGVKGVETGDGTLEYPNVSVIEYTRQDENGTGYLYVAKAGFGSGRNAKVEIQDGRGTGRLGQHLRHPGAQPVWGRHRHLHRVGEATREPELL